MKSEAQLGESIDRFRRVFWNKETHGRPPLGVVDTDVYLPARYLKGPFSREYVEPADVDPQKVQTDYEFAFARRRVWNDDFIPFVAPWRAIPWLEAWCGCPVRYSKAALTPVPRFATAAELEMATFPADDRWFACLEQQIRHLLTSLPDDCWLSPTILRGCSDVLAALRGLEGFACDLYDAQAATERAARQISALLWRALDLHFALVPPKHGGYGHIFGYWAPGPTVALQEDVLGLCRPTVFRDLFFYYNAEIVRRLGPYVIFHLHSTGFQHYRHVLDIPGLAGLQMTIEANGPPMAQLAPVFREILERSRLMIFADHRYAELEAVLPQLPTAGLYVVVPQRFISSDGALAGFLSSVGWRETRGRRQVRQPLWSAHK